MDILAASAESRCHHTLLSCAQPIPQSGFWFLVFGFRFLVFGFRFSVFGFGTKIPMTTGSRRVWRYRLQAASFDMDVKSELTRTYLQRPPKVDAATPSFVRTTHPTIGFQVFGFFGFWFQVSVSGQRY